MSRTTELVAELETIIQRYGLHQVSIAFDFLRSMPVQPLVTLTDGNAASVSLTTEEFTAVKAAYNTFYNEDTHKYVSGSEVRNKIHAIKKLREFTNIGLKEAKDIVEFNESVLK